MNGERQSWATMRNSWKLAALAVGIPTAAVFGQSRPFSDGGNPSAGSPTRVCDVFNFGVLDPEADRIRARGQFLESWANARRTFVQSLIDQEKYYQEKVVTRIKRWEMHDWKVSRDWDQWQLGKDRLLDNKIRDRDRLEKATSEVPPSAVGIAGGEPLNTLFEQIKRSGSAWELRSKRQELPNAALDDLRLSFGVGDSKVRLRLTEAGDAGIVFKKPVGAEIHREFDALVAAYAKEREAAIAATSEKERTDALGAALDLLFQMNQSLTNWYGNHKPKVNTDPKYLARREWSNFIDEQLKQMKQLSYGKSLPQPFHGSTVQELLEYMRINGLLFAKADRGGENTYLALFDKMRAIVQDISNH